MCGVDENLAAARADHAVFVQRHPPIIILVTSHPMCEWKASELALEFVVSENYLSDAFDQLSGTRPARILCYLPEVTSFEVLKTGSAIQVMTNEFFDRHRETVHSVVYVSDPIPSQTSAGF